MSSVNHLPHRFAALLLAALAGSVPLAAQNGGSQQLTQLQFDIVGVRLVVDPPSLTVPKQIATQINTRLELPAAAGTNASEAMAALADGGLVEATLRGPAIPPTRITARPGQPLPLPPFALPGDYFLDGIRLVKDGVPLLDATAPDGRPATTYPYRGHQRRAGHERHVASVVPRRDQGKRHRHRREQLPDGKFRSRVQHRWTTVHHPAADGAADA
jgi:hypothetical protein